LEKRKFFFHNGIQTPAVQLVAQSLYRDRNRTKRTALILLEIITLEERVNGFLRPSELHPEGCSCKAVTWSTRQWDQI